MSSAIILGAGLSGLSVAYELKNAGWTVRLLDSGDQPGGVISTEIADGFLSERGPNSFMLGSATLESLLTELGLKPTMLHPPGTASKRFLVRRGRAVAAPSSAWAAVTSPLLSPKAKLRLLTEPFRSRPADLVEESVANFVRRRVGPEFLDYLINPLVGGIYAGDPERLSLAHAFPRMDQLELQHGSLVRGALAKQWARRTARKEGTPLYQPRLTSFRRGLSELTDAFAQQLRPALRCQSRIERISHANGGSWSVRWEDDSGTHTEDHPHLVLALPAHRIKALPLPPSLLTRLAPLDNIPHPPLTSLFLGYHRDQIKHPLDGFGMLVPAVEKQSILGVLFSSSLFPGRAPADHHSLTVFIGGTRQPHLAALPTEQLLVKVLPELASLLQVEGQPTCIRPTYWSRAIPQYTLGYQTLLDTAARAEREHPGLHLAGNWRGGIAVGQCLENGRALARKLVEDS